MGMKGLFNKGNIKAAKTAAKEIVCPDIQILMLGARRVGKTSVLASMINEFKRVSADSNLVLTKKNAAKAIDDALQTMKGYFLKPHKLLEPLCIDNSATPGFDKFDLELSIAQKNSKKPRHIRFVDLAGEWINKYENESKIAEEVEHSDIIIVAIDSVLLMEKEGKYQHQNCAENVTNFITKYMKPTDNSNPHKMVLFVPLKCERYYHQHFDKDSKYYGTRMNTLNSRIKEEYSDLFGFLTKPANKPYFTVAILPILSLGGIEFSEFSDKWDSSHQTVTYDELSFCYCEPDKFEPMYCEQPLLYTLMFEQKKIDKNYFSKAYKEGNKKKIIYYLIEWFQDRNNYAKDTDYINELKRLEYKLVKSGNGFDIIQDPLGL